MDRRTFLRAGAGLAGASATTGCLSRFLETRSARSPPVVEDRPDAVYYPSHVEGMEMAGMGTAGPYELALAYSFPHRFWLITGRDRKKVQVEGDDSVHLMATVWDPETNAVLPASNLSTTVTKGGEGVASKRVWPMLSQNMGFHYGDNVALDGDGTYDVEVTVDPVGARRTGAYAGKFGNAASTTVSFEFSQEKLDGITFERLDEKKGQRGATSPMEMGMMPVAATPERSALPGTVLGEATSGDGVFVATVLSEPPTGIDASGSYLAVSARTPYNGYPLPMMSLSATLDRDGETVFDGPLEATLDPDLGYHYGATVESVESGDGVTLSVGVPPQVARHEGYETAFYEMPSMNVTV